MEKIINRALKLRAKYDYTNPKRIPRKDKKLLQFFAKNNFGWNFDVKVSMNKLFKSLDNCIKEAREK